MKPTLLHVSRRGTPRPAGPHPRHRCSRHAGWLVLLACTGLLAGGDLHGADLLKWDVTGSTGTSGSSTAAAVAPGVSGGAMSASATTGAGNSTSPSNTWNRTISTVVTTAADAMTAGNYFQFTTSAAEGYKVNFSGITGLSLSRTSNGPTSAGLFYSTDGGTVFTQTGGDFTVGTTLAAAGATFSTTMATTPLVLNGGSTIQWRVVVWGGSGGRVGIGKALTDDVVFTGTSVSDVVVRDLVWTGTGGGTWNTDPANTNWANPAAGNAAAAFAGNDNARISSAAEILVDAAGVSVGNVTVDHPTGTVSLSGGTLTALSLTKSGAGLLALGGSHAFSGGTTVAGGKLRVESNTALGTAPVTIQGAVLATAAGVDALANAVTLGSAGATLETGGDVTFNGNLTAASSAVALVKTGSGQLNLAGGLGTVNTSPVDFDLTEGSAVFSGTGTTRQKNLIGTTTLAGNLTLAGSTVMLHGSAIEGSGSIVVTNATSSITSRLNLGRADVRVPITLTTSLNVESPNGGNDLYLNAPISGEAGLVKKGNGVVRLAAANTHATTTVEAGTLSIDTGGTLGSGDVTVAANATLRMTQGDVVTVSNTITGAGGVRMSGTGTVTLGGINTYVGATTMAEGTLAAPVLTDGGVAGSIGQAPALPAFLVLNGGTLAHTGPATTCDRPFTLGTLGGGLSANGTGPLVMGATGPAALAEPTATGVAALNAGTTYRIVTPGDTDFTLIGAPDNNPDTVFTATGPGLGTGTVVYANPRTLRLAGTSGGISVLAADLGDAASAPTQVTKNGTNTWSLTGTSTYSGTTRIHSGVLRIDGDHSAAAGPIQLYAGGALGGNGTAGGAVVLMEEGGGLAVRISDWTGAAGTGHDDLAVASFNGNSLPLNVTLDTSALANFSEGPKSFTILTTSGGITGFNRYGVKVSAPGFNGNGYWSLRQDGKALVLDYSLTPPDPYLAWVAGFGLADPSPLVDSDGDSLANAMEFVLNGNPAQPDRNVLPQVRREAGALVVTLTRRADAAGLTQKLRYGSDLKSWNDLVIPATPGTHTVGVATVVVATTSAQLETVTVSIPLTAAAQGRLFACFSVTP